MTSLSVASLGSGSKGNATLISYADTLIMVDNGFSCKETEARLSARNIFPQSINHLLVTHEHADHCKGVAAFANKYQIAVWANYGTSLHPSLANVEHFNLFDSHQDFQCGELHVTPVVVPHDAREACQFVFTANQHKPNQHKLGLLTDLGSITPLIIEKYANCHILLLEFNYEYQRLLNGSYPASLKARISGDLGHLSNQQSCEFLSKVSMQQLQQLVVMHISEENNCPTLVEKSLNQLQLDENIKINLAQQSCGFDWIGVAI